MQRLARLVLAMAGVQIGHAIVHALPHPHPNDAAHGYIPMAAAVLLPLGAVALISLIRSEWRTGDRQVRLIEVAALQVFIFTGQEILETMSVGGSALGFLTDPVMWAGLAVQMAVGWIVVWTLSIARTAVALALTFAGIHTARPAACSTITTHAVSPVSRLLAHCTAVRGPPALSNA